MAELPQAGPAAGYPAHVAIIMDGNGRWAQERQRPRLEGHRRGAQVVRDITTCARELGIEYLTLYSFSRQNWCRPALEVAGLMALLEDFCRSEAALLHEHDIKLTTIGDVARLPPSTREALEGLCAATGGHGSMTLCLAVDYGGREEIVAAVQRLAHELVASSLQPHEIDEAAIGQRLDTAAMPDPDLLIRTSGERRISNFLLWQLAYAEMHFTQVRWPDFTQAHFIAALEDYRGRQRRFGHTQPQRLAAGEPAGLHVRTRGPITDFHEGFEVTMQDALAVLSKDAGPC